MRVLPTIAVLALALSAQASADGTKVGSVMIFDACARASDDVSNTSTVYMILEMTGDPGRSPACRRDSCGRERPVAHIWLEGCFVHRHPVQGIELSPGRAYSARPHWGAYHAHGPEGETGRRQDHYAPAKKKNI